MLQQLNFSSIQYKFDYFLFFCFVLSLCLSVAHATDDQSIEKNSLASQLKESQPDAKQTTTQDNIAANLDAAEAISANTLFTEFSSRGSRQLYQGTFVYSFENQLQTIKVFRQLNADNVVLEKFLPLDGPQQSSARMLKRDACLLDNGWVYQFHPISSSFPFEINNSFDEISRYYDVTNAGLSYIAGIKAIKLEILPKDTLRYGFNLWFEPSSASLLKYQLLDNNRDVIEQYLFTDFHLQIDNDKKITKQVVDNLQTCTERFKELDLASSQFFSSSDIPEGFRLILFKKDVANSQQKQAKRFHFSDGLNSVSVFIEDKKNLETQIDGMMKLGPMNVAGKTIGPHQVTVLGAIPVKSILQLLDSVKLANN